MGATSLDAARREHVAERLRVADQRFTRNRQALVAVLASACRPLTIPEIVAADTSLAMSTVYRNLAVLEEVGVVHRVVTTGEFAHYELAEDLTEHHHHLICTSCGAVKDVNASPKLEQSVRDAARDIARRTGFRTERHVLDLIGRCDRCA